MIAVCAKRAERYLKDKRALSIGPITYSGKDKEQGHKNNKKKIDRNYLKSGI